jgi:hypothetical protein
LAQSTCRPLPVPRWWPSLASRHWPSVGCLYQEDQRSQPYIRDAHCQMSSLCLGYYLRHASVPAIQRPLSLTVCKISVQVWHLTSHRLERGGPGHGSPPSRIASPLREEKGGRLRTANNENPWGRHEGWASDFFANSSLSMCRIENQHATSFLRPSLGACPCVSVERAGTHSLAWSQSSERTTIR